MFSWDSVPGDHNEKLIRYLRNNFDIDWVEKAEISKCCDSMTISISTDANSAEIKLSDTKEKAILKISDDRTYGLKVMEENGKLNIYTDNTFLVDIRTDTKISLYPIAFVLIYSIIALALSPLLIQTQFCKFIIFIFGIEIPILALFSLTSLMSIVSKHMFPPSQERQ